MTPELTVGAVDWTAWADDPYPLYRQLRNEAPVYYDELNDTFVLTWITIAYASANRDERQFPDPDSYVPGRDLRRHVAFSYGIHYCAGAPLTRYEVTVLLNELLDRFETIERAGPSTPWPTTFPGRIGKPPGLRHVPLRLREAATR